MTIIGFGREHDEGTAGEQPAGCLVPSLDDVRECLDLTDDAFALAAWPAGVERLTLFRPAHEDAAGTIAANPRASPAPAE